LKLQFPQAENEFFEYLEKMNMSDIKIYGFNNGEFVLPNEPLLTLEGTLDKIQIIETTLLNLTNYPTLISSLSSKLHTIFKNKILIEDGSINSQSPNGAIMGIKYSHIGGIESTTNLLASKLFNLPLFSYTPLIDDNFLDLLTEEKDFNLNGQNILYLIKNDISNEEFLTLKDNLKKNLYGLILTQKSSTFNYTITSLSKLNEDLKILSLIVKFVENLKINLILNFSDSIYHLKDIKNSLSNVKYNLTFVKYNVNMLKDDLSDLYDLFDGVILGPEFLVSYTQPALGMVYKINEIMGKPCIKFSEEKGKQTIPGFKNIYRIYDPKNELIGDFMCLHGEFDDVTSLKKFSA